MIFYFSATGNTLWAAQQLSEKTGERLVFIPDAMEGQCHYTLATGERIGFCFPVHAWRPPVLVRRFIERLSFTNAEGHYCFALCTERINTLFVNGEIGRLRVDCCHSCVEKAQFALETWVVA